MELWEAQVAVSGAIYGDMHLLEALRVQSFLTASQWGGEVSMSDIARYPWDDINEPEEESDFDFDAMVEASKHLDWTLTPLC